MISSAVQGMRPQPWEASARRAQGREESPSCCPVPRTVSLTHEIFALQAMYTFLHSFFKFS